MDPATKDYVRLKVVWKLKDIQKNLGVMKREALILQRFTGQNLTDLQIMDALETADKNAQEALKTLTTLKKDVHGFLRRI